MNSLAQFLDVTRHSFEKVEAGFRDAHQGIATSTYELSYIAAYLQLLSRHNTPGSVLECGTYKGFSTCCLSLACRSLGRHLFAADSFRGLPPTDELSCFGGNYRAGDLCAAEAEVWQNLRRFGSPENVTTVAGWYRDSLKNWEHPLSAIWLDVDLYDSASDVLNATFSSLQPGGLVFSHEIKHFMRASPWPFTISLEIKKFRIGSFILLVILPYSCRLPKNTGCLMKKNRW
jgi:predicted O-methyltransferase YrrM